MALALIGAATLCVACAGEPSVEPVRIGVIISQTGDLSTVSGDLQRAAELAVREVNARGGVLSGRPIELLFEDDATDAGLAARAVRDLVDAGVVAIVGPLTSAATVTTHDVAREAGIPQVTCCASSENVTLLQPPEERYLFRTVPSDAGQAEAIAYQAAVSSCAAPGVVRQDDLYGATLGAAVSAEVEYALGVESRTYVLQSGDADYDDLAEDLLDDGVDCALLVAFPRSGGRFVRSLRDVDAFATVTVIGSEGLRDHGFVEELGDARLADGIIGTAPDTAPPTVEFAHFERQFQSTYGRAPGIFGAHQFDAVLLLALAIEAAGTTDGTAVRDQLFEVSRPAGASESAIQLDLLLTHARAGQAIDYRGASGNVDFDEVGNVEGEYELWRYEAATDDFVTIGRYPDVLVRRVGTLGTSEMPLDEPGATSAP